MAELPQNWILANLNELCTITTGKKDANAAKENGEYKFFTCAVEPLRINTYIIDDEAIILPGNGANVGMVLYYNGKFDAYQRTYVLYKNKINTKYLYYYLKCYWATYNKDKQYGSATNYIRLGNLTNFRVKVPPLNEQKRIVKKLDSIMPKVDEVNERLEKIPLILKRARQSILNQATTGELTKDWRKGHSVTWTTESLINKINTELSNLLLEKKILKENSKISSENIEKINDNNWYKIKARYLCHHITKGTTPKKMTEIGDIPYLKVYNIVNNKIDFEYKPQFVSNEIHNNFLARSKVYPDDVLMNIVGPPLGKIAIVPNSYAEWNINQAIAFFRPIKYLLSEYLYLTLCCESTLLDVLPDTKGIVGQSNISLEQCRDLQILLPPVEEQTEIVKRVKEAFEKLDKIEEQYKKAKSYTDKLTQSILYKAFKGDLVPQDPNDKPLEII